MAPKGNAKIEAESTINNKNTTMNFMGYQTEIAFKGKQTGTVSINLHTGMLQSIASGASVEGIFHLMGREVPINIKKEIAVKRL